jgi:glycerol-3-phosphate dehydrogenase (NAD(P)+)
MKAVVLGSGGWGTALSQVLCDNGFHVNLWSHNPEKAEQMQKTRENALLKGVTLPEKLRVTGDISCVADADLVVSASPSYAVRATAKKAAAYLRPSTVLVSVSKGIERDTNLRMSQIVQQETGGKCRVIALSGPSHAEEVGIRMPTGCVAACEDVSAAKLVQDTFMNDYFRVYTSPDIVGVELCGALKNVVALSCGISDGMGFQDNTKALLMTRAMVELSRLGTMLGGDRQTFGGLAGMGDLIVTCTSMHSRNRRAGILIGQGKLPKEAMEEIGAVVEGYYAAASVEQLARREGVEMPICHCAYEVLYHDKPAREVVSELMGRAKKDELENGWSYPVTK